MACSIPLRGNDARRLQHEDIINGQADSFTKVDVEIIEVREPNSRKSRTFGTRIDGTPLR